MTPEERARDALGGGWGIPPCDCIVRSDLDTWHIRECYCKNAGDAERAADWCARENSFKQVVDAITEAIQAEREACAETIEAVLSDHDPMLGEWGAQAIRARKGSGE